MDEEIITLKRILTNVKVKLKTFNGFYELVPRALFRVRIRNL